MDQVALEMKQYTTFELEEVSVRNSNNLVKKDLKSIPIIVLFVLVF